MKNFFVLKVIGIIVIGSIVVFGGCYLFYNGGDGMEIISKLTGGTSTAHNEKVKKPDEKVNPENIVKTKAPVDKTVKAEQLDNKKNVEGNSVKPSEKFISINDDAVSPGVVAELLGSYNLTAFTNGNIATPLVGIKVNNNNVQIVNYNGIAYTSTEPIKKQSVNAGDFKIMFGQSPEYFGLSGNSFPIYWSGEINMYKLPNGNLLVSFRQYAFKVIKNDAIVEPSNISRWYGNYVVTNKEVYGAGSNHGTRGYNGIPATNITGKQLVLTANEFKYGDTVIDNPNYYIINVQVGYYFEGREWFGNLDVDGPYLQMLAVTPQNQPFTRLEQYNDQYPSEKSSTNQPILLGPNGNVQVNNNISDFYNTRLI